MQKLLNTPAFFPLSLARGIRQPLLARKSGFIAVLALLLSALSIGSAYAATFDSNLIFVTGSRNGVAITPITYYTNSPGGVSTAIPFSQSNAIGSFDRTSTRTDELFLNAESNTTANSNETVAPPILFYRVYRLDSPEEQGQFIPIQMELVSGSPAGTAKWTTRNKSVNLIEFAPTPGTYFLEVYFQAAVTLAGTPPSTGVIFDGNNLTPYKTTFQQQVNGQLFIRNTWAATGPITPGTTLLWSDASNWSTGNVPNFNTDVIINRNTNGAYPVITNSSEARVRNLTIAGNSPTQKASLTHTSGALSVSGNFQDPNGGYTQAEDGILYLSGTETQVFDASSRLTSPLSLYNLGLTGKGAKIMTANLAVTRVLEFVKGFGNRPLSGPLVTANFAINLGTTGQIIGETSSGYVDGTVISTRDVGNQSAVDFGNIGVTLTANRSNPAATSPGLTTVTRNNYIYFGIGTSQSISRGFTFVSARTNIPQFNLEFKYLENELNGIAVSNLKMFRSDNGDIPFESLGFNESTVANTFTKTGITGNLAALYTLGDAANPLPVTLVKFTAAPTAQGNAVLRWTTATETNNKGFGIERQLANGDVWQPVGYLATGNNATGGTYEFTDKSLATATATPQAYYRLRQEDLDGKLNYSPVAVVARPAAVASTGLLLSPVPVTGATISLTFAEASQAGSEITVTNTQGQRLLNYTTKASAETALSLPVEKFTPGVYIVSVKVPGQALRYARFVKI